MRCRRGLVDVRSREPLYTPVAKCTETHSIRFVMYTLMWVWVGDAETTAVCRLYRCGRTGPWIAQSAEAWWFAPILGAGLKTNLTSY